MGGVVEKDLKQLISNMREFMLVFDFEFVNVQRRLSGHELLLEKVLKNWNMIHVFALVKPLNDLLSLMKEFNDRPNVSEKVKLRVTKEAPTDVLRSSIGSSI